MQSWGYKPFRQHNIWDDPFLLWVRSSNQSNLPRVITVIQPCYCAHGFSEPVFDSPSLLEGLQRELFGVAFDGLIQVPASVKDDADDPPEGKT
jgi:hypothetical protein